MDPHPQNDALVILCRRMLAEYDQGNLAQPIRLREIAEEIRLVLDSQDKALNSHPLIDMLRQRRNTNR